MRSCHWILYAFLFATIFTVRTQAEDNHLVGRWFVSGVYGNPQILSREDERAALIDTMSELRGKEIFAIASHKIQVVLKDAFQTCDITSVVDLGDALSLSAKLLPAALPDFANEIGSPVGNDAITGRVYEVSVGKCTGPGRWLHTWHPGNYFILSRGNLAVYTNTLYLELSRHSR